MKLSSLLILLFLPVLPICSQTEWKILPGTGQLAVIESSHSMFPHPQRMNGHTYKDGLYSFKGHYDDSSTAVFIPENFVPGDSIDLVFYFHGWGNNIHKSLEKFKLLEQFSRSAKNAVLVFPQGPKNAPDSFGGKLEEKGMFKNLVNDVLEFLRSEKKTCAAKPDRIILSGHSGAFRVISFILNRGGLTEHISEVYLFDGLYGQLQKFAYWLCNSSGRLINIITPNGGTKYTSDEFLADLTDWNIQYYKHEKNEISADELKKERIIFIYTDQGHSEIINPYFKLFLKTSGLKTF